MNSPPENRIVAIRPEPGLSATIAAGEAAGFKVGGWPLFEIRAADWAPPSPKEVDGLLLGSANAIRHAGAALAQFTELPIYAVGASTAQAARQAGFEIAATGEGGLQTLLEGMAGRRMTLLRLAGAENVPLDPPEGVRLVERIVYESSPLPVPDALACELRKGALVLLHSAAAARHLGTECDRLGIARGGIRLAALGPRIAAAAGEGWGDLRSAQKPNEAALLALLRDMCHSATDRK